MKYYKSALQTYRKHSFQNKHAFTYQEILFQKDYRDMEVNNVNDENMTANCRIVEIIPTERNLTTVDTNNDAKIDSNPMMGYARVSLLPLVKACAPLVNIVHDIMFYVQMALNETPEEPENGLTIDESAAIRLYTIEWQKPHRSLYLMLNCSIKNANRTDLEPYFKYLKLFMTALVKLPCIPSQTIWRGVTRDFSVDLVPDAVVTWWSFSSCTTTMIVLENNMYLGNTGPRTLFSVEAINGRRIRGHSHYTYEDEIILLPGTHMIVQSRLNPASDLHIFHLKQLVPKYPLLDPPFKGM